MNRLFSSSSSRFGSSREPTLTDHPNDSNRTVTKDKGKEEKGEPLPVPSLKVKRVDNYYSRWSKGWKYRDTSSKVAIEAIPIIQSGGNNDQWREFNLVIVRTIPRNDMGEVTYRIVIKSDYLLKACRSIIRSWPGVSWNADPLELDPSIFITFHAQFKDYEQELATKAKRTELERNLLTTVKLLNSTIASDYKNTLAAIDRLTKHGEITFEYLYAILIPRTLFVVRCAVTGQPRLLKLKSVQRTGSAALYEKPYQLLFTSIDLVDRPVTNTSCIGKVQTVVYLAKFRGAAKIDSLDAYPVKYHHDADGLRRSCLERGRKWVSLLGIHHKQYNGVAAFKAGGKVIKQNVSSRVMVDRASFRRVNSSYPFPQAAATDQAPAADHSNPHDAYRQIYDMNGFPVNTPPPLPATGGDVVQQATEDDLAEKVDLTEEELMLAPAAVYGFSLNDKSWLEMTIDLIEEVDWNDEAFANLVLPQGRKELLQSLVESHHRGLGFDDFIKGKGHGLVVNLYGPPGVGKTFSAEATSEHVQRPLYVVGGGDLGTTAAGLDSALEKVFDVATAWKAIVLIDEADVFLEQRSMHDLERNAMVAVFLRHVEYYRGILFLTTNRVKAFDEAFLSRIHVAMHFDHLNQSSKEQVWAAFIAKAGATDFITPNQITELAKRDINGRQIKNAVRTAHSLAVGRGSAQISFENIVETLDAMAEFTRLFDAGSKV